MREVPEVPDLKNEATKLTERTEKLQPFRDGCRVSGAIPRACGLLQALGMLTSPAGMNTLTHAIIGCGIRVHREIGPGVLENIYNECMQYELRQEGLRFDRERAVPLVYKGQKLRSRYYIDLVVEDRVIVELKTVVEIAEIHKKQVLTQLKLAGLYTGLIMNFNVEILTDGGVKRVVNPAAGPDYADPDAQV
jgi:GxxExxY protein